MATEISVHDNFILSYTVDNQTQQIIFRTAYYDIEPYEYTDVIFLGVVGYHFEGDNFKTILFDIDQVSPEEMYSAHSSVFERRKNYAWLPINYNTKQELIDKLRDEGIKCFLISSSYGMEGLVLAQELRLARSSVLVENGTDEGTIPTP